MTSSELARSTAVPSAASRTEGVRRWLYAPPDQELEGRRRWAWWALVGAVHAALFGNIAYRMTMRPGEVNGPNLFSEHAMGTTYAFSDWWRPGTPGYLYQVTSRLLDVVLPTSDYRLGAVISCIGFYALFGIGLFEVLRRTTAGRPLLGLQAALVGSCVLALLETPSAFIGWQRFSDDGLFLPLYLPFVPTTLGVLGLNLFFLQALSDLLLDLRPARSGWRLVALTVVTTVAKPTLVPLAVAAAPILTVAADRKRRRLNPEVRSHLPRLLGLAVAPAAAVMILQTLATVYKVNYPGTVYDDRGGWTIHPFFELSQLKALTVLFWLGFLFPVVALAALRHRLWSDLPIRLAASGSLIGIVLAVMLARTGSPFRGDLLQLPEATLAALMIFIPRRVLQLWRDTRIGTPAVVFCAALLAAYLLAGITSWACRQGLGCLALV